MATNLPASVEHLHRQVFLKYLDEIFAYLNNTFVLDPVTQFQRSPDESFMRDLEEWAEVPEQSADDFRRNVAAFIGVKAQQGFASQVTWDSHPMLKQAIEDYLGIKAPPETAWPNHKYRQTDDPWEPAW